MAPLAARRTMDGWHPRMLCCQMLQPRQHLEELQGGEQVTFRWELRHLPPERDAVSSTMSLQPSAHSTCLKSSQCPLQHGLCGPISVRDTEGGSDQHVQHES